MNDCCIAAIALATMVTFVALPGCSRKSDLAIPSQATTPTADHGELTAVETPTAKSSDSPQQTTDDAADGQLAPVSPPMPPMADQVTAVEESSVASQSFEPVSEPASSDQPTDDQPSGQQGTSEASSQGQPTATQAQEAAEEPSFRLLLPTTSGPLITDVNIRIGDQPLAIAFSHRIGRVIDEASGRSGLTWPRLFQHVNDNQQQFGRSSVNSQQHRNLIRLFDKNRNKIPDHDEVARFLFRNTSSFGPFRLVGSNAFREINRSQSALFAAMDRNENRVLDADEVESAQESLSQLDQNGDQRIDHDELGSLPADMESAWPSRRVRRWGDVAMDLSGYVDWTMLSYTLDDTTRTGAFGQQADLRSKLDQNGDGSIDADETRSLSSVPADFRLLVRYPRVPASQPAAIEVVSVAADLAPLVQHSRAAGQIRIEGDSLRLFAHVLDGQSARNMIPPEAFAMLDANNDGELDEREIPDVALREYSFEEIDQDGNGKLTLQEINERLGPESPIWNIQIRARAAESPDGVFAWLDKNQDNALSTREIAGVTKQLKTIASAQGDVTPEQIPDTFLVQFGRGDPNQDAQLFAMTPDKTARRDSWPPWAQSMDTNRDGDISRREFPGNSHQFGKLDKNSDSLIDLQEVRGAREGRADQN